MKSKSKKVYLVAIVMTLFAATAIAQTSWQHVTDKAVLMPGNPGEWDDANAALPVVIKDGDTLRMWYNGFTDGSYYGGPGYSGYAWSLDGVTWHKHSENPIKFAIQAVIKNGDHYLAWAPAWDGATLHKSSDGIHWKQIAKTDLKKGGAGEWDSVWFRLGMYHFQFTTCWDNKSLLWWMSSNPLDATSISGMVGIRMGKMLSPASIFISSLLVI